MSMERLSHQIDAYVAWKRELMREITRYRGWLERSRLNSPAVEAKLERALRQLRADHITLAFVGEFSRGKTELINSLFFAGYGQRMLPSHAGRTTMCPTELFHDPRAERSYIRLLPIETRLADASVAQFKRVPRHWVNIPLDTGDPEGMAQAFALAPTHLSWYQLTMEPNTVFWSQPPELPEDDILWDIQEAGQALLDEHGYRQYETSAYARDGLRARHNLNYWSFGDFLGIGAGAHAKLSAPDGRIVRTWKTRLPKDYLNPQKAFQAGERPLEAADLPFEFMMNVLRLVDGVPAALYPQRTGQPLAAIADACAAARDAGLLADDPQHLRPSERGQLFLNDLLQHFLP